MESRKLTALSVANQKMNAANRTMAETMVKYQFNPNIKVINELSPTNPIESFEKEVGVYSATPEFIRDNCGAIANQILDLIPSYYYDEAKELGLYPNCDIRIHRLYPSDYPAYPGWHCDGEYRETYFSQPDLNKIKVSKHIICTVSSHELGISNCRFLNEPFEFETEKKDEEFVLWREINDELDKENHAYMDTQDGKMYLFDSWSLHKTMPAIRRGWRLFFRMAMWHRPNLGKGGMITKQEQIYKYLNDNGW
jgi:hypothetical protein